LPDGQLYEFCSSSGSASGSGDSGSSIVVVVVVVVEVVVVITIKRLKDWQKHETEFIKRAVILS